MMTDISKPLIAIEFGDQMKLIDGNHRLHKAVNTGKQTVKAIFLSHPNIYDILEFMTKRFTKR